MEVWQRLASLCALVGDDVGLAIGHCQVQPGSDEDTRARAQLELPMRHGGMGLHRLSPVEGSAAFLSTAALTNVAMAPQSSFGPLMGQPAQASARSGPCSVSM